MKMQNGKNPCNLCLQTSDVGRTEKIKCYVGDSLPSKDGKDVGNCNFFEFV